MTRKRQPYQTYPIEFKKDGGFIVYNLIDCTEQKSTIGITAF